MTNRHGLSRDIPAEVKRVVRQRCGYGCVICGAAIIEYEHVDPPFAQAKVHDPNAIALLCPQCHAKTTRGFMAKDTIQHALANPAAKAAGYSNELFDLGREMPKLVFAGAHVINTPTPIEVHGVALFQIDKPEDSPAPFRLSGNFFNSFGEPSLTIVENEWRPAATNWDVEATGGVITVRDRPRHVSLRLRASPPDMLIVEKLEMIVGSYRFVGNYDELVVETPSGAIVLTRCIVSNCRVGYAFR